MLILCFARVGRSEATLFGSNGRRGRDGGQDKREGIEMEIVGRTVKGDAGVKMGAVEVGIIDGSRSDFFK